MIKWKLDDGMAGWALGSVDGIAVEMQTGHYVADMTEDVANMAKKEMGRQLDILANAGNDIEHVYEFKKSGTFTLADRLFHIQKGSDRFVSGGTGGARQSLTFKFIPSKKGGPSIKDRIDRGELSVSSSDKVFQPGKRSGKKVSLTKRYVFVNKASMLEFGGQATILPRNKKIFVPFSRGYSGDRPYAFLKGSQIDLSGNRHRGKFSAAWTLAAATAGAKASEYVEERFAADVRQVNIRKGGTRKKTFGVAFIEGKAAAKAEMMRAGMKR